MFVWIRMNFKVENLEMFDDVCIVVFPPGGVDESFFFKVSERH